MRSVRKICAVLVASLPFALVASAQAPYTPDTGKAGFPTNGVFSAGSVDSIQLANGNLHVDIPLLHLPGIGMDTDIHFSYDSGVWNIQQGPYGSETWNLITMSRPHWQIDDPMAGFFKWGMHPVNWTCNENQDQEYPASGSSVFVDFMSFTDGNGTSHSFPLNGSRGGFTPATVPPSSSTCSVPAPQSINTDLYSTDATGYNLVLNSNGGITSLTDKHGTSYSFTQSQITGTSFTPNLSGGPPANPSGGWGTPQNPTSATSLIWSQVTKVEDTDGNQITCCGTGNPIVITDTVGRTITEAGSGTEFSNLGGTMTMEAMGPQIQSISYKDQNGNTQTITINYETVAVNLLSLCYGINTLCGAVLGTQAPTSTNAELPESIVLQNGDTYQFQYLPNGQGQISSITLPTGAVISYTWGCCNAGSGSPPVEQYQVASRSVTVNGESSVWNYAYTTYPGYQTTMTDPNGNDTVFVFTAQPPALLSETSYNGRASSNLPLITKSVTYGTFGCNFSSPGLPISDTVTWNESGQTTETDTNYDSISCSSNIGGASRGNVTSKVVYDYGTGGNHGPLLSNTVYSYLSDSNSNYNAANIADRESQVSIYNSLTENSSTLVAQTTTAYDQFSQGSINGQSGLVSTSGTTSQHDYTNYGTGNTLRGLPTSVIKYTGPNSSAITTYVDYNDVGKETVATDARGNSTTFTYGGQNAFLTATTMPSTNGIAHVIHQSHDLNTGLLIWKQDQNLNQTNYQYDNRMRPTLESRPDGGSTTSTYPDPNHVTTAVTEDSQRTATTTVTLDGLGRKINSATAVDSTCGLLSVDSGYDLLGRLWWTSNPHCSVAQSTDGYSVYSYDAIGRMYNKQNPDGSSQTWRFSGSAIDFYDETARHWQHTYDAEDRLVKVLEPNGSTTINVAPTLETDYSYDTLGNLLEVDQWGGSHGSGSDHLRQFAYDATSRLVGSDNPESASTSAPAAQTCTGAPSGTHWTTCYVYDGNGNLTQKTDNRGVSINYSYDALNRLLSKSYSDSTPPVAFTYDSSSITGYQNDVGQMTQATVTAGSTILAQTNTYKFDPEGRLLGEQQCTTANNCSSAPYALSYAYDWAGKPISTIFPSNALGTGQPLTLNYSYDATERLLTATSNWAASGDSKHPGTLFQASTNSSYPAYGPMGLLNASIGFNQNSGTTTSTIQRGYDDRGRVIDSVYAAGAGAISDSTASGAITISGTEAQSSTTTAQSSVTLIDPTWGMQYGSQPWQCTYNYYPYAQYTGSANYYTGSVAITIQSSTPFPVTAYWGPNDESEADVRTSLVSQLNASGSPVTAVLSGNNIVLTSKATGTSVNYPITVSQTTGSLQISPTPPPNCN